MAEEAVRQHDNAIRAAETLWAKAHSTPVTRRESVICPHPAGIITPRRKRRWKV